MGFIKLAAPVVHVWFSRDPRASAILLDMKTSALERIVYYQDYVVIDPGDTPLKDKQLLTEDEWLEIGEVRRGLRGRHEPMVGIGAEALKIDLDQL